MAESICFVGDGVNDVWLLPFMPRGELAVSVIQDSFPERRLLEGRDYTLSGNRIIIALAAGARLLAREVESVPLSASGINAARVYGLAAQTAPAWEGAAAATGQEEAESALERRYNELSARMRLSIEEQGKALMDALAASLKESLESALAELEALRRKGRDEARLAQSPLAQRARLVLDQGCRAGAYISAGVAYLPGTNSLLLYINGSLAAPEVDYEEVGSLNEASTTIRLLKAQEPCAVLDCVVCAIPSGDSARRAADQALAAQKAAATLLADAREAQSQTANARAVVDGEISLAQGWANAAQKSADYAYQAAVNAYDAAAQISLYRREPGICAVRDKAAIHACSPGLFIINPHLSHAPTPFFGVWPAESLDDMSWDGVFFLGGKCYPEDPCLPPKRPPRPAPDPVPAIGGADEWIPCGHGHQSPPKPCACPPWPPRTKKDCDCAAPEAAKGEGEE